MKSAGHTSTGNVALNSSALSVIACGAWLPLSAVSSPTNLTTSSSKVDSRRSDRHAVGIAG